MSFAEMSLDVPQQPSWEPDLPETGVAGAHLDSEIARKRREEILSAAEAIIASEGLPRLSLGQIEKRARMSRGQLTYYFPTKEAILLAVFDRMLARMIATKIAAAEQAGAPRPGSGSAWDCLRFGFQSNLSESEHRSPANCDLFALIHTFLAQIGHREDFRVKLAAANDQWRQFLAADMANGGLDPQFPPELVASIVMALMRGLSDQLAVDSDAFDRPQMAMMCLHILAPLFGRVSSPAESES
ncbi:MAG: TetR/AcrR family transcriptional regulator [Bacteroidales bacterium]|nr:TetR/AcrR family transcriptional regulator [Bacteroidales bacterium]